MNSKLIADPFDCPELVDDLNLAIQVIFIINLQWI